MALKGNEQGNGQSDSHNVPSNNRIIWEIRAIRVIHEGQIYNIEGVARHFRDKYMKKAKKVVKKRLDELENVQFNVFDTTNHHQCKISIEGDFFFDVPFNLFRHFLGRVIYNDVIIYDATIVRIDADKLRANLHGDL